MLPIVREFAYILYTGSCSVVGGIFTYIDNYGHSKVKVQKFYIQSAYKNKAILAPVIYTNTKAQSKQYGCNLAQARLKA